jgi:hypothetical protein
MTAIKNIFSAIGFAFLVASCGVSGETDEQELATSIDQVCQASTDEECQTSYEELYGGRFDEEPCGRCLAKCKKECRYRDNYGCEQSCESQCKGECGELGYE